MSNIERDPAEFRILNRKSDRFVERQLGARYIEDLDIVLGVQQFGGSQVLDVELEGLSAEAFAEAVSEQFALEVEYNSAVDRLARKEFIPESWPNDEVFLSMHQFASEFAQNAPPYLRMIFEEHQRKEGLTDGDADIIPGASFDIGRIVGIFNQWLLHEDTVDTSQDKDDEKMVITPNTNLEMALRWYDHRTAQLAPDMSASMAIDSNSCRLNSEEKRKADIDSEFAEYRIMYIEAVHKAIEEGWMEPATMDRIREMDNLTKMNVVVGDAVSLGDQNIIAMAFRKDRAILVNSDSTFRNLTLFMHETNHLMGLIPYYAWLNEAITEQAALAMYYQIRPGEVDTSTGAYKNYRQMTNIIIDESRGGIAMEGLTRLYTRGESNKEERLADLGKRAYGFDVFHFVNTLMKEEQARLKKDFAGKKVPWDDCLELASKEVVLNLRDRLIQERAKVRRGRAA